MYVLTTLKDVDEVLDYDKPIMFDTETIGLHGEIRLAQFYQKGWDTVMVVDRPVKENIILFLMILKKAHIVCHNAAYDVGTIQRNTNQPIIPKDVDCTMYLSRLKYCSKLEFSLDLVMTYALGFDPYKQHNINKKEMQDAKWEGTLTEKHYLYASIDVFYLAKVYDELSDHLDDFSYQLDKTSMIEAFEWQNNGFPVDQDRLRKRYKKTEQEIKDYNLPINCNSYKQVRPYINCKQSDDLALAKEEFNGNERAKKVRAVRKLSKRISFMNKWMEPKIYGLFAPSARSGRYTCQKQNLQQLARDLKECFGVSPDSGKVLMYSDFSSLELRSIAAIVNEVNMVPLLKQGKDLHDYTARTLFGDGFTKEQRRIAKTANFLLLYGGGVEMFQTSMLKEADIWLDFNKAKNIKFRWHNTWLTITSWQQKGVRGWRAGKVRQTPLGRKYSSKMLTDYLNIEVSGFGAEVAKLAMHYLIKELKQQDLWQKEVQLVNFVHDSYLLVMDNNEELYKRVSIILADAMQSAWFACASHTKVPDLPMPVEVLVGYNWGDIEDGDYIYKHKLEGLEHYDNS